MGRVRSALRSYALMSDSPETVLELTDRKVLHFEIGTMVTVVCAMGAPPYKEFRIASAGHVPPLLAPPNSPTRVLELPVGVPLGVAPDVKRDSARVQIDDGAAMLLYTDGLIERRGEVLDEGLHRVRTLFRPEEPQLICNKLLRSSFGSQAPTDDVAIVVMRRTPRSPGELTPAGVWRRNSPSTSLAITGAVGDRRRTGCAAHRVMHGGRRRMGRRPRVRSTSVLRTNWKRLLMMA